MSCIKNNIGKMFKKELVVIDTECHERDDVLSKLSEIAFEKGYVYESFTKALLKRENDYPTGIELPKINIAIPHTDAIHVKQPGVIVAKMNETINFETMGIEGGNVDVEYIFMLMLHSDGQQPILLQSLINMCLDEKVVKALRTCINPNDIFFVIKEYIGKTEKEV